MNRNKKPVKRKKNNGTRKKIFILIGSILLCIVIAGVSWFMVRASYSSDPPDPYGPSDISTPEISIPITSIETSFAQTLDQLMQTSTRITGLKINQTMLSLSGLNESVKTIMENQTLIIDLCNTLSEKVADIPEANENKTLFSEINQLNENLDSNCDKILEAKKQRNISAMESLLSETARLQCSIIERLKAIN